MRTGLKLWWWSVLLGLVSGTLQTALSLAFDDLGVEAMKGFHLSSQIGSSLTLVACVGSIAGAIMLRREVPEALAWITAAGFLVVIASRVTSMWWVGSDHHGEQPLWMDLLRWLAIAGWTMRSVMVFILARRSARPIGILVLLFSGALASIGWGLYVLLGKSLGYGGTSDLLIRGGLMGLGSLDDVVMLGCLAALIRSSQVSFFVPEQAARSLDNTASLLLVRLLLLLGAAMLAVVAMAARAPMLAKVTVWSIPPLSSLFAALMLSQLVGCVRQGLRGGAAMTLALVAGTLAIAVSDLGVQMIKWNSDGQVLALRLQCVTDVLAVVGLLSLLVGVRQLVLGVGGPDAEAVAMRTAVLSGVGSALATVAIVLREAALRGSLGGGVAVALAVLALILALVFVAGMVATLRRAARSLEGAPAPAVT